MESGDRFGILTYLRDLSGVELFPPGWAAAQCDCGKVVALRALDLTEGKAESCGCTTQCPRCRLPPNVPHECKHAPTLKPGTSPVIDALLESVK